MLRIYSVTSGPAAFLGYQASLFERFLADDFELIVVNDGQDGASRTGIAESARSLGLRCEPVRLPPCGDPSVGLARAMKFALETLASADEIALFVHGDVFPCRPLSVYALFEQADVVAHPELKSSRDGAAHVYYPWSGIVGLRVPALVDLETVSFAPGSVDGIGCDTGGKFATYAAKHETLRMRALAKWGLGADFAASAGFQERHLPLLEGRGAEIVTGGFFHFLGGSGWHAGERQRRAEKQAAAFALFDDLLAGELTFPDVSASTEPWPARP